VKEIAKIAENCQKIQIEKLSTPVHRGYRALIFADFWQFWHFWQFPPLQIGL